ncbi:hypothetical protein L7F22_045740, partial [Adiantum nelumboides]|nr:hypothetical protein [Adiantum nelumboides]
TPCLRGWWPPSAIFKLNAAAHGDFSRFNSRHATVKVSASIGADEVVENAAVLGRWMRR